MGRDGWRTAELTARHARAGRWAAGAVLTCVLAVWIGPMLAQAQQQAAQVQRIQLQGAASPASEPTTGGASVETATDAIGLIERARNDLEDGQLESAVRRLMYATERFGSSLIELESGVLVPTTRYVDLVVSGWAANRPEALATYRRLADAEALGVLGGPIEKVRDPAKLEQVIDRYLLSSIGDEAAYRLACHWIDLGRFADAATLLQRLSRVYPDPTVERTEVLARLALAHGRSGAASGRDRALKLLAKRGAGERTIAEIRAAADMGGEFDTPTGGWPMTGGRPDRLGTMPPLDPAAEELPQDLWAVLWSREADASLAALTEALQEEIHRNYSLMTSRASMNRRWREQLWRPTFQLAAREGKLCFVAAGRLHCINAQTGMPAWDPVERQGRDGFDRDGLRIHYNSTRGQVDNSPNAVDEVLAFGDRVLTDLSIVGRTVYYLQPDFGFADQRRIRLMVNNNRVMLRELYQANRLVAVDLSTGKVRWSRPVPSKHTPEGEAGGEPQTRVVVAPVPAGDRLLTVAEDDGDLFLLGLSPQDGAVLWRRFLCSAGESFAPPWARVGLAVDGQAAFVVTNRGLVFAADASSGEVRWASRYPRTAPQPQRRGFQQGGVDWSGHQQWDNGRVMPIGQRLIVTAPDSESLLVFDRFSGELIDELTEIGGAPVSEMRFVVGATRESVVLGGPDGLASLDPAGLGLRWYAPMPEGVLGRPAASAERLYVPTRQGVVEVERATGRRLTLPMPVSDSIDEPVGNLFLSEGHLFGGAGNRLTALGNARLQVARLSEAAEQGDPDALAARARLLAQLGQTERALSDLRNEFRARDTERGKTDAASRLIALLIDAALAEPKQADNPLAEAAKYARTESQKLRVRLARAEAYVAADRTADAVQLYHKLAMAEPVEPLLLEKDESNWYVRPDVVGRRKLKALIGGGGDGSTAETLERLGRPVLDQTLAEIDAAEGSELDKATLARLRRIAAVHPGTKVGEDAVAAMAPLLADSGMFTMTELTLRSVASEGSVRTALPAAKALAHAYHQRRWHRAASSAYKRAWRLDQAGRVGDDAPPAAKQPKPQAAPAKDDQAADADAPDEPASPAEGDPAEATVQAAKPTSPAPENLLEKFKAVLAEARDGVDRPPFKQVWAKKRSGAQMLTFTSQSGVSPYGLVSSSMPVDFPGGFAVGAEGTANRPRGRSYGWLARQAIVYVPGTQKLTAYDARTGDIQWVAPLPGDTGEGLMRQGYLRLFSGGFDGHVLAISTPSRSFAVDIITGKRLWTVERSTVSSDQSSRRYRSSRRYDGFRRGGRIAAVGGGLFVEAVAAEGRGSELIVRDIAARDSREAAKPLWRRELSGRQFTGLELIGDRIGVLLDGGATAVVYDAQTGRRLHRFETVATNSSSWRMWTPYGLATQDQRRRITVQPLEPGRETWTFDPPQRRYIRSWQLVSPKHILVFWHDRRLTLLDLESAKADPVFDTRNNKGVQNVFDAAMGPQGQRLLLAGSRGSNLLLSEHDARTGKQIRTIDLGRRRSYYTVNVGLYQRGGRLMPTLIAKGNRHDQFRFQLLNLDNGEKLIDKPPEVDQLIDAPQIKDGVVMITTREGIQALGGRRPDAATTQTDQDVQGQAEDGGKTDDQSEGDGDGDEADGETAQAGERPAKPASAKGVSIKSKNGQVIVRSGGRTIRVDVEGGARVRVDGGNVIINGKAYSLKGPEADADQAEDQAKDGAEAQGPGDAASDEANENADAE